MNKPQDQDEGTTGQTVVTLAVQLAHSRVPIIFLQGRGYTACMKNYVVLTARFLFVYVFPQTPENEKNGLLFLLTFAFQFSV